PFLVYAYLHEELANAVLSKPDLRKKSLLVDGGLQEDEARRLDAEWRECERRKSGAEVKEAYLKGMGAKASFFFFYSFHPYNSIRSVCTRIMKALRGRKSEVSVVAGLAPELKTLIDAGLKGSDPSLVVCACLCLQSVLSLLAGAWQEHCAGFLEDLFEKANDWLLLDDRLGCKKAVHDTMKCVLAAYVNWIKKEGSAESGTTHTARVVDCLLRHHASSDPFIPQLCFASLQEIVDAVPSLPSSSVLPLTQFFLGQLSDLSNRSKLNAVA
ncbi:hypothetical protein WA556_002506, partial [Blastocystis sp. ATCC 50177/Nand II]